MIDVLDKVDASQNLRPVLSLFVGTRPELTMKQILPRIFERLTLDSDGELDGDKDFIMHYVRILQETILLGKEHVIPYHKTILKFMR